MLWTGGLGNPDINPNLPTAEALNLLRYSYLNTGVGPAVEGRMTGSWPANYTLPTIWIWGSNLTQQKPYEFWFFHLHNGNSGNWLQWDYSATFTEPNFGDSVKFSMQAVYQNTAEGYRYENSPVLETGPFVYRETIIGV